MWAAKHCSMLFSTALFRPFAGRFAQQSHRVYPEGSLHVFPYDSGVTEISALKRDRRRQESESLWNFDSSKCTEVLTP